MVEPASIAEETLQFANDGFTIRAFLARPMDRPGRLAAVVVLHEWWGLNAHAVDIGNRFAAEGYVAAVIDLYSRQGHKVTQNPAEAGQLMSALSTQGALRDINALVSRLKAMPFVDGQRLGIVGFSMGGSLALIMAQHNSDFKAAVAFYGKTPPIENVDSFLCPIQFHDAAKDEWVTRKEVDALRESLLKNGKSAELIRYPEADHAFFNDSRPEVFRRQDAEQAWRATLAFLQRYGV